jgi:hypothetical protein
MAVVYSGHIDANVTRTFTYNVPALHRIPMVYKVSVGGRVATGKLLPGDASIQQKPNP